MYKSTMNVAKGVGLGLLTGAAVAAIGTKAMGSSRHHKATHMKKSAGRAIHTVTNVLGDMEKLLR